MTATAGTPRIRWQPLTAGLIAVATLTVACSDDSARDIEAEAETTSGSSGSSGDQVDGTDAADGEDGATGGSLTWGKPRDPVTVDPILAGNADAWQLLYLSYETLVEMGPNLEYEPGLAESWENPEPTTWLFHLQDGVTFSNGREMTVDDVVGSLQRVVDPEMGVWWAPHVGDVAEIAAEDDDTVRIELNTPNDKMLGALAGVTTSIMPLEELEAEEFDPNEEMLGTGPYMVAGHRQDESWTFEANPHYWRDGQPVFEELTVQIMPDDAARVAALRDGRVDVANFDHPDAVQLLEGVPNVTATVEDTTDVYFLQLRNTDDSSVLADERVRQAINTAIDRDRIVELAFGGLGEPAAATPPGFDDSCNPEELPSALGGPDEARALLDEAGAGDLQLELLTTPGIPGITQIAQIVQQDLAEVGIDVEINDLELGAWTDRIYPTEGEPDFEAGLTWYAGFGDPTMLAMYWDVERSGVAAGFVAPNEDLAAALREAETLPSGSDERVELLEEVCRYVDEDAAMIPLVTKPVVIGSRDDRVELTLPGREGYADVFRFIAESTPA